MKNYISRVLLLLITALSVGLTACKKNETVDPVKTPQLAKVTYWNPSTGAESSSVELNYDANGTVTGVVMGGTTYTATYNAANKLSLLSGVLKGQLTVSYALEYNTAGQLIKVVNSNGAGTSSDNSNTKTLTYNAAGKVTKMSIIYVNTAILPQVIDYTWNGDNIATATTTNYVATYTVYDDKLSPFSLADGISVMFYGNPPSKNNFTEVKTVSNGLINIQKRGYEYNAAGYATSMKLLDVSGEGQKYYYR
jgi:hypothetical protein